MKKNEIREYQLSQMELLEFVDSICTELNINYYIIGGTLLGAVRHKGFIPWDADMDIAMKRDDYEEFRKYMTTNGNDKFFYQHYSTDKLHFSPHAILRIKGTNVVYSGVDFGKYVSENNGIYLDIFPLDEPPADVKLQELQAKKIKRIKNLVYYKISPCYSDNISPIKRFLKAIIRLILRVYNLSELNEKMDKIMQKYNGCGSGYLVSMASHYSYKKQLMPYEIYGEPIKIEFEDHLVTAPAKTEEYLERIYGDYMELPPEDKRYSDLDRIDYIDYGKEKE